MLNGEPGMPIKHGRGLRQGDPPLLFILTMDPLQWLLDMATRAGLLHPIGADLVRLRTSMYADDTAMFIRPVATDVNHLQQLLQSFGQVTGLCINILKSEMLPIRCDAIDLPSVLGDFQATITGFPCRYLGLPLSLSRLKREDEQSIIDKVASRLPNWKGRILNRAGRLVLVNSVLSSSVTYYMTVFQLSKWALKKIDRIRRRFLWHGADSNRHGHCLVNWKRVTRPKRLGGLGLLDLARMNQALRLRWAWLLRTDSNKPWHQLPPTSSPTETALFRACTEAHLCNGRKLRFWHDRWIAGQAPKEIAPALFRLAWRKNYTVADAICNGKWMRGLRRISSTPEVCQFVHLWRLVHHVQLTSEPDSVS
jgi:hypothetical protein